MLSLHVCRGINCCCSTHAFKVKGDTDRCSDRTVKMSLSINAQLSGTSGPVLVLTASDVSEGPNTTSHAANRNVSHTVFLMSTCKTEHCVKLKDNRGSKKSIIIIINSHMFFTEEKIKTYLCPAVKRVVQDQFDL